MIRRRRGVVVNMKAGHTFRGIMWSWGFLQDQVVLKQAAILKPGGEAVPMDGEVVLFKRDVDFIQVLR
ncbi:MAG TPA: hypothetical protein DDW19_03310 [Anaerolineaceae bacterium]|nr:hypothetical protein [Anaerolineaceae bacterium]